MKLFCALEQATESADDKSAPALEKQVEDILGQLGTDFAAAWDIGDNLEDKSADGVEFSAAVSAVAAKCQ